MYLIHRISKRIRRYLLRDCLEDLTMDQRRMMWPAPRPLAPLHIRNCKILVDRDVMLELMPKGGICIEIGILHCQFSKKLWSVTKPKKMHLVDIESNAIEIARRVFQEEISSGIVEVHHGDSADVISKMPDMYFDWVYVDGDHSYQGVTRDLTALHPKLKHDGFIALNDYTFFGPSDFIKYGVVEAVNEFCVEHDFEMLYYALQGRGYNDVCLRKIKSVVTTKVA